MNKPILYISIGALIAFLLSAIIVSSFNLVKESATFQTNGSDQNTSIFTSQSATFEGMITGHDKNMVTLKNGNNMSEEFPLAATIQITKFSTEKSQPTVSTNPQDIETNKNVSVVLTMIEGNYQVVNITYIPERAEPVIPPPTTRTGTQSANPR